MRPIKLKPKLIIAGPGAGKTHNMVASIIEGLPTLSAARYMVVITYTNSAANNISNRLSKLICIPENLFIGTMHSFLNKFVVMPFSSYGSEEVGREKLFLQCDLKTVFSKVESLKEPNKRSNSIEAAATLKKNIRKKLNTKGYITFDQTLSIAKDCVNNSAVSKSLSNRIQFLYVDEFQDSGNDVFGIIENIRKQQKTIIYCVGDPEQYIQSFNSSIKNFHNIPILKAASSNNYDVTINNKNFRSTVKIILFLNNFNGRNFKSKQFQQEPASKLDDDEVEIGTDVLFIQKWGNVKHMIDTFYHKCETLGIAKSERCILAKKNDVIRRIEAAVKNDFMNPKKDTDKSPMKIIQDTLLSSLQMNQTEFCIHYQTDIYTLRKHTIALFKAINNGRISNENTYANFVSEVLKLTIKEGIPVKIDNLKFDYNYQQTGNVVTLCNIHTIKGLEAEAVLAIAKTEEELLLWLETDPIIRDLKRDNEKTDYPRLGYVAFSRAKILLSFACLEEVSLDTRIKLKNLNVQLMQ